MGKNPMKWFAHAFELGVRYWSANTSLNTFRHSFYLYAVSTVTPWGPFPESYSNWMWFPPIRETLIKSPLSPWLCMIIMVFSAVVLNSK